MVHQLRLESALSITRHSHLDGACLRGDGLDAVAVEAIVALTPLVGLVPEVRGHLCLQQALHQGALEASEFPLGAEQISLVLAASERARRSAHP